MSSPQVLSSGSYGVLEGHGGRWSSIAEKSSVEPWPPGKSERRKCWQSWEVIAQEARHLCNRAKSTVTELPQSDYLKRGQYQKAPSKRQCLSGSTLHLGFTFCLFPPTSFSLWLLKETSITIAKTVVDLVNRRC